MTELDDGNPDERDAENADQESPLCYPAHQSATPSTDHRLDVVRELPWVDLVVQTDRENASHYVEANVGVVRTDHEIHDLENAGVRVVAISTATDRIYIDASATGR